MKIMREYTGNIVDVAARRMFYGVVGVEDGLIVFAREISKVKDDKCFLIPGFVDSHIHVESSMLIPSRFADVAVRVGVVGVVNDPHEIANVLGVDGVNYMIDGSENAKMKFFFGVPSCVPSCGFDVSGADLDSYAVEKMFKTGKFVCLSEMMNFPGVLSGDAEVRKKIKAAVELGLRVDGHAPGLVGDNLAKYIKAGVSTDHECMTIEEAKERIVLGMKIQIREGSAAKNFDSLIDLMGEYPDMLMFCSDDCHPDDLLNDYFVGLVRRALKRGFDLFDVLRASGYNAVKHYNLPVGLLQEGDFADFLIVDNLVDFNIQKTIVNGELVYERNQPREVVERDVQIVNNFVQNFISVDDLNVFCSVKNEVSVRVIDVIEGELLTKSSVCSLNVNNGIVSSDVSRDILKVVVLNRYEMAKPSVGFIRGFGLKKGAIASSVSHDSHNIIAVGVDDESIAKVVNAVVSAKGGLAYADAEKLQILELPVAGIMSVKSGEEVAEEYANLLNVAKSSGAVLKAPFMTMAFMSLIVIPELKINANGLFDVLEFKPVSLFVDEQ